MSKYLSIDNNEYISSVAAGESVGYSHDYLSRLCRSGNLECRRIGRVWYIEKNALQSLATRGVEKSATETETVGETSSPTHNSDFYAKAEETEKTFDIQRTVFPDYEVSDSEKLKDVASKVNIFNEAKESEVEEGASEEVYESVPVPSPIQPKPTQQVVQPRQEEYVAPRARPVKSIRKPVRRTPTVRTPQHHARSTSGSVVGVLVAVLVMGGGYTAARAYDSPVHVAIQEMATTAKIGTSYITESIAEKGRGLFYKGRDVFALGLSQVTSKKQSAATLVVLEEDGIEKPNATKNALVSIGEVSGIHVYDFTHAVISKLRNIDTDPSFLKGTSTKELLAYGGEKLGTPVYSRANKLYQLMENEAAAFARAVSGMADTLAGQVVYYGEVPADLLATAFNALTNSPILSQTDSLYEPIYEGGITALADEDTIVASTANQIIEQTIVNQPVIERIVEKHFTVIESGVTLEQLQQSENELRQLISTFSGQNEVRSIDNFRSIALSQRIDNLGSVDITNSTFASGTISSSSASLTSLTVSGGTTFDGGVTFNGTTTFATAPSFTDLTLSGDLTISGDDLFMGTNTSGFILVADGTNFNPVALSGDVTIDGTGATTIGAGAVDLTTDVTGTLSVASGGTGATSLANLITLGTDTTGNYLATLADAGSSFFTITGSGSESAAATIDIAADSLNFTELSDTLALDASTDIAVDGTEVFSITNTGTGNSFVVNDVASDTTPFVIDASGNVGIGTSSPGENLSIASSASNFRAMSYNETTTGADIYLGHARGSEASPTATQSGDDLGRILISGYDTAISNREAITFVAAAEWGTAGDATDNPFYMTFSTTQDGGSSNQERLRITEGGDVGIGVTDPDIKLEVFETVAAAQLKLSYDATRYTQFQTDSVGDLVIDAQGGDVFLNDESLFVCTGGSCPAGTPASTGTIIAESRIGIGTSDPVSNLEIVNNVAAGMDAYTDYQILLHDSGTAATSIGLGVETGTLAFNTDADYDFYIDGAVTPEVVFDNTNATFQGNIVIAGKLDVDTIDPVYTISGVKYATYGHSTIGIKEEAVQVLSLDTYSEDTGYYEEVISFNNLEKGSDLWLFYQVSSFGEEWNDFAINLTPSFDGRVFYEKDHATNTLRIYSSHQGEVSARFIASRYDSVEWPNLRPDQGEGYAGHVIEEK